MVKTLYYAAYLAILGIFVTLIAYAGYAYTKPIIDENTRIKIEENIALLFSPEDGYHANPDQIENKYHQSNLEYANIDDIYEVLDSEDELYALVYNMQIQGRNDIIHALVAIDPYQDIILGVVYYQHGETPNLGEKYTRDEEVLKLIGQSIVDVNVDLITGATTTWTSLEMMYQKLYEHFIKEVHLDGEN